MNNTIEELYAFVEDHPELDEEATIEALKEKFPEQLVNDFIEEVNSILIETPIGKENEDGRNEE